jgi:hypothetical protein
MQRVSVPALVGVVTNKDSINVITIIYTIELVGQKTNEAAFKFVFSINAIQLNAPPLLVLSPTRIP